MNKTFLHLLTRTLFSYMAFAALLAGCVSPATTVQIVNTLTPEPEPEGIQMQIETPTPPTIPQPSFLVFSYITSDAGNFALLAGETITFTWENAPADADKYEFLFVPLNGEPSLVFGLDLDDSDGVAISWTIPENIAAELHAKAYFSNERTVEISFVPTIFSGDFPPSGVCSLIARHQPVEVYHQPDRTAEVFALLYPAVYAHVLEIATNGWYRIDASVAELYTPPLGILPDTDFRDVAVSVAMNADLSPASGNGWVNSDKGVLLTGSCPPEGE